MFKTQIEIAREGGITDIMKTVAAGESLVSAQQFVTDRDVTARIGIDENDPAVGPVAGRAGRQVTACTNGNRQVQSYGLAARQCEVTYQHVDLRGQTIVLDETGHCRHTDGDHL